MEGFLEKKSGGKSASPSQGTLTAIAVGEVTTYDFTKDQFRKRNYEDNFALHVATSLITGLVATTVAVTLAGGGSNRRLGSRRRRCSDTGEM